MNRRLPKMRLIDDSGFAIQHAKPHVEKPDFMFRSKIHGDWIRTLPCCRCQQTPVEAAHVRYDTQTAKGVQPHDFWLWPGCPRCHRGIQHQVGEITKRTKALKDALETLSAYGHGAEARRIKNTYQINLGDEA